MHITKDMGIGEIVEKWPETVKVFQGYGMHCLGCAIAQFETLEDGVNAHGIDLNAILQALNTTVSNAS